MPFVLVPKQEYVRLAPLVLEHLDRYFDPVDESEFSRSPDPPLQRFAAGVELVAGRVTVLAMQRLHGGHAGTGASWRLNRADAESKLPKVILKALGERPEDIKRILSHGKPTE